MSHGIICLGYWFPGWNNLCFFLSAWWYPTLNSIFTICLFCFIYILHETTLLWHIRHVYWLHAQNEYVYGVAVLFNILQERTCLCCVILFIYINHERHSHVVSVVFIDIIHGTTFYDVYALFIILIFYMTLHLYDVAVLFIDILHN